MSSPNSVSHEIADTLRSDILRGQYRVGERLPSERDLSGRFDVSRGAVREALSQLEQQGIIETQPGGVRIKAVKDATLAILGPLLAQQEVPDPDLVDQFLEVFCLLTRLSVKNAVGLANPEQLIHLRKLLVKLERKSESFEAMQPVWEEMLEFMASIDDNLVARLIGNDVKAQFVGQMLGLDIKLDLNPATGQRLVKTLETAFIEKDGEMAAAAFEKHFDQLRVALRQALEAMQGTYQKKAS